ncbi:condensation domain-containing protein [Streptomyces sp. CAU 1734]|uniref:condensation domain-containing protein n=1 Tax=Streptomyces sp. CAU 1734 TaxID=3140360 RepID=UPI003260AEA0
MSDATPTTAPPPAPVTGGRVELTAAQTQVLAAQRAAPANAAYNVGQYIELTGPLDTGALEEAVRHTLAEAPSLHFRLIEDGGRLWQEPVPAGHDRAVGGGLPRLDTSGAGDPTAAAVELVREQLACPPRLDLQLGPEEGPGHAVPSLTGAVLVRVGPERHLLFQYFHHLAVDGYGVALLTHRIAEVYTALRRGTPPSGSPFAPVGALVAAEREYTGSARYAADRAHWAARCAGAPPACSFARGPGAGSAPPSDTALRHTVLLDRHAAAAVHRAAGTARTTWAETVTAALAVQLHRETGTEDAVLAMYAMARTAPGTLRVPGMAVNILPLRLPLTGRDTFAGVLARTAGEFASLRAHQRFRGEELARDLWPGRDGARLPGPLLNLRPFDTELDFAGTPGHVVTLASGPVDDLSVSAVRYADGRLRLDFDANPALYDEGTLTGLARRHADLLGRLCAEPERRLGEFALLDAAGVAAAVAQVPPPGPAGGPASPGACAGEAGGLPPLPSAHRLRETGAPVDRLHDSVLLQVPPGLSAGRLRRALARLADTHGALRLRLHRVDGVWAQEILPSATAPAVVDPDTLRRVAVRGHEIPEPAALIAAEARSAAHTLEPERGAVLRAVWFDAGPSEPGRLLLVAHRLSVDEESWPVLAHRLAALYAAPGDGREAPRTAPEPADGGLRAYAAGLVAAAQSPELVAELPYWRQLLGASAADTGVVPPVPRLHPAAPGTAGGGPCPETVTEIACPGPGIAPRRVDGAVLAALALAAAGEPRLRGDGSGAGLLVAVELPDPDRPAGAVGALTRVCPVRVDPAGAGAGPDDAAERASAALAAVPGGGRGHELLRHLNPQTAPVLARAPGAIVRYRRPRSGGEWSGAPGWTRAPGDERRALREALAGSAPPVTGPLEVTARTGPGGLVLHWRWAEGLFTAAEARELAFRVTATVRTLTGH